MLGVLQLEASIVKDQDAVVLEIHFGPYFELHSEEWSSVSRAVAMNLESRLIVDLYHSLPSSYPIDAIDLNATSVHHPSQNHITIWPQLS